MLPREVFAVPVSSLIGRAVSKSHQCFVCASRFLFVLLYSFADQVLAQLELFWYSHVVLSGITKCECFVCSHRHRLDRIPLPPGLFSTSVRLDCQRSVSLLRTDAVLETTTKRFDASPRTLRQRFSRQCNMLGLPLFRATAPCR